MSSQNGLGLSMIMLVKSYGSTLVERLGGSLGAVLADSRGASRVGTAHRLQLRVTCVCWLHLGVSGGLCLAGRRRMADGNFSFWKRRTACEMRRQSTGHLPHAANNKSGFAGVHAQH
jgi:hypothetical protein